MDGYSFKEGLRETEYSEDGERRLKEAVAYVNSFPSAELDAWYSAMSSREMRVERLAHRYGLALDDLRGSSEEGLQSYISSCCPKSYTWSFRAGGRC